MTKPQKAYYISRGKWFVMFCIWSLLIFAAARPQWLGAAVELPRSGRNIMLAVDLSGSMQIPDMFINDSRVSRLAAVKQVAGDFIKRRHGDRIGLILFGSKAYLQTPLTFDRHTVFTMLNDASIGLAGRQTAIGDATGLAIKRLPKDQAEQSVIILLTDGVNNTGVLQPLTAAGLAAKRNIRIYTIGIGQERSRLPGVIDPITGLNTVNELDAQTLKAMAEKTGGNFFRAPDIDVLKNVYRRIDKLEPVTVDTSVFRPLIPLYPWPLTLALLLSITVVLRFLVSAQKGEVSV